jgi:hypothetical protein
LAQLPEGALRIGFERGELVVQEFFQEQARASASDVLEFARTVHDGMAGQDLLDQ